MPEHPSITIPRGAWKPTGAYHDAHDTRCRLLTDIEINGTPMHLEAVAVTNGEEQRIVDPEHDQALDLNVGDGGFPVCTTAIAGREYVLIATPCGD
ncbi:hypothetical protein EPN42_04575 [bacterium]|nr:MAG: hypothetical protein EPN42_04575 [bacterium]